MKDEFLVEKPDGKEEILFANSKDTKSIELLKDPELFKKITNEFNKKIEGEMDNCKSIFLTACGIFVENHQTASFNLCVNSSSGAGKDFTLKNVLNIFPDGFVQSRTRVSPTAFTYWHNSKFEPEWNWDGKICYLQDVSDSVLNSDVFKVMCSEGSFSTVVIEQRAVDIKIAGKPVLIISTADANPKNEMLRRFPILTLDESKNQTREIMRRQAVMAKEGKVIKTEYSEDVKNIFPKLKRVKVKIPFADKLAETYSDSHIIMRTHFQRLLDLIKASAALHQYQREKDENEYIIADEKDYAIAIIALRQTTQNALMIPLTKKQQKLLDLCKSMGEWFSAPELSSKCNFLSAQSIYNYLDKLQENFLETDERRSERSDKPVKVYKLKEVINIKIPSLDECENVKRNSSNLSNSTPKTPLEDPSTKIINTLSSNYSLNPLNPLIPFGKRQVSPVDFLPINKEVLFKDWESEWLKQAEDKIKAYEVFWKIENEASKSGQIFYPRDGCVIRRR
jgi:hypothetical protein